MSERTSSFSSSTSCPSMSGPAASDATLSPSVRSLSPISPLPNVPTFCLTPYPEQTEFPESINMSMSDSPLSSPKARENSSNTDKEYPFQDGSIPRMDDQLNINDDEGERAKPKTGESSSSSSSSYILPNSVKPPTPRRRVTSPSFLIPPSLKMSSLTSTIPSPTNPPPLSPHGRAKAPFVRPRVGRSATISSNSIIPAIAMEENKSVGDQGFEVRKKPEPLILQQPISSVGNISGSGLTRTKSSSILNLLSRPQTPIPSDYEHEHENDQDRGGDEPKVDSAKSNTQTAKPLTSRRIGIDKHDDMINQDRWYSEQDLRLDMEEPRLGRDLSPGWGEFDFESDSGTISTSI
ncbi:hypothetical protein L486_06746 [Kwoniella mangroviensis CBS 10435]|uniref:Uncharacterized protein n=1 Tax=Kwoniella mangroviensis CBS 10435 TaxID=1331196 RepID=A0A1B9IJZ2_9TREE|nr:hypothetical protein L486_06746 [Kwoniella mangroviensis CBS 10435]